MEKKIANIVFKPRYNSKEDMIAYDVMPDKNHVLFRIDPDAPEEGESIWIKTKSLMVGNHYDFDNQEERNHHGVSVTMVGSLKIYAIPEE